METKWTLLEMEATKRSDGTIEYVARILIKDGEKETPREIRGASQAEMMLKLDQLVT